MTIHYSSTTFYGGQLQAIKIRNVPLADCIEINELDVPEPSFVRNTNPVEASYILQRCIELLGEESAPTVGVITPFREQQSFISHLLGNDARSNDFRTRLKVEVMTFDSCQGEERNIIFYSMVATRKQDLLNYIFPVELKNADELVGGARAESVLRASRPNAYGSPLGADAVGGGVRSTRVEWRDDSIG